MPSKPTIRYERIEREVSAIIARGAGSLAAAYRRQALATNWEVGCYLKQTLPLDQSPSANNARIIGRLAKKFDRPDSYFYMLIKFARVYPQLPSNGGLSWSHYEALLKVSDDARRRKYEQMALQRRLSAKILYGIITKDKIQGKAQGFLPLISGQKTKKAPTILLKRGRLYHYRVTAPKDAESNTGTATIDLGFSIYRDVPLSRKSKLHVGHMVRTLRSETSGEIFHARIADADKDKLYIYKAQVTRVVDGDTLIVMIDLGLKTKTKQRLRKGY